MAQVLESTAVVHKIAMIAHEANKAYCLTLGDDSQLPWDMTPEWQRKSAINGVIFHMRNPNADAGAIHENWFKEKQADGWSYGPVKDPVNKRHPCFVPFAELPVEQQIKDHIFRSVVHGAQEYFNAIQGIR